MAAGALENLLLLQNLLRTRRLFLYSHKSRKNRNLELFSKQVVDLLMPGVENISFHTTEAVFDFIDKILETRSLCLL